MSTYLTTLFDDPGVSFDVDIAFDGLRVPRPTPIPVPVPLPVPAVGAGGGGGGPGIRIERPFRPEELEKFFGIPHHKDLVASAGQYVCTGAGVSMRVRRSRRRAYRYEDELALIEGW